MRILEALFLRRNLETGELEAVDLRELLAAARTLLGSSRTG